MLDRPRAHRCLILIVSLLVSLPLTVAAEAAPPAVLDLVTRWILERFGKPAHAGT